MLIPYEGCAALSVGIITAIGLVFACAVVTASFVYTLLVLFEVKVPTTDFGMAGELSSAPSGPWVSISVIWDGSMEAFEDASEDPSVSEACEVSTPAEML